MSAENPNEQKSMWNVAALEKSRSQYIFNKFCGAAFPSFDEFGETKIQLYGLTDAEITIVT